MSKISVDREDLQVVFDMVVAAEAEGLLGECHSDPCPVCTALANVQFALSEEES